MNFSRHIALLRLSQITLHWTKYNCVNNLRFYCSDLTFTSAAPNKFFKNENNTDVKKTTDAKTSSLKYSIVKYNKTKNISNKQNNSENVNINNIKSHKIKNIDKSLVTKNYNSNNYKFSNYKSNPNSQNKKKNSISVDRYIDMYDDENIDDKLMDEEFLNEDFMAEKFTKEDFQNTVKERMKKSNKPSKQTQNISKVNLKLEDNPMYQIQLTHKDEEDDINLENIKKLEANEENDNYRRKITFDQTDNPVYHFDHTLTEFPNDDNSNNQIGIDIRKKSIKSTEGIIEYDLSPDEFNVQKYIKELINIEPTEPLEKCEEDISDFGVGFGPTFNFASFANKSELVQEYVKLGVKLYKVEKNMDHMRALMSVDLKEELPIYIQFLHDCGVPANQLGDVITENPMVLKEDLDDMKTRIRYLRAHDFTMESIARIVTKNPTWLTWATKHIDERLGHFQNEFKLIGSEVRYLATKQPKLITYTFKRILENTFAVREEMGFTFEESKALLLFKPRLWMNKRKKIVDTFDYLHNTMKLSHLMILSQADTLACRKTRLENRHEFLVELKKVQYDPKKPNYISPSSVVFGSDVEFCRDIAKVSIDTFNLFLKTR